MRVVEASLPHRRSHKLYSVIRRFKHPEKLHPWIVDFAVRHLHGCKCIYDPFAGVGTTALAVLSTHSYMILADIEECFVSDARMFVREVGIADVDIVVWDSTVTSVTADCVFTSPPFLTYRRGGGIYVRGYSGKYGDDPNLPKRHERAYAASPGNMSNYGWAEYWSAWRRLVENVDAKLWAIHARDVVRRGRIVETWKLYAEPLLGKGCRLNVLYKLKRSRGDLSFWQILMGKRGLPVVDYDWLIIIECG